MDHFTLALTCLGAFAFMVAMPMSCRTLLDDRPDLSSAWMIAAMLGITLICGVNAEGLAGGPAELVMSTSYCVSIGLALASAIQFVAFSFKRRRAAG